MISLLILPFSLLAVLVNAQFYTILSVHTTATPYCPKVYTPDASYIGCCGYYQSITYGKGPDGSMSPGCCLEGHFCTDAPPIMYDWSLDDQGYAKVITLGPAAAAPTAGTATKASVSKAVAGQGTTGGPTATQTGNAPADTKSGGLSTGAMIGIIIPAIGAVITAIGIAVKIYLAKRKEKFDKEQLQKQEWNPQGYQQHNNSAWQ